jgi:hypothetical protein
MDINTLEEKLGIANLSDAEKLALVKGIESNVQASKAAVKAQEAGQYASLVVDAVKRIKNDLETRFNELNGIIDVKAKTLQDGKDGLQGAKGEKGDRGFDGTNGKDGYNGKDGIDGVDGKNGVGVQDAYIDFDGSLIIKLTDGTEINVGEVVPMDVAEKIKVIGNGGGTSQSVLDSLESLQDQINTLTGIDGELGTMAQQDDTSVDINGGAIDNVAIGATTPAAGTFTTLTATTSVTTPIVGAASGSSTTGLDLNVNSKAQARFVELGDGTRPLVINGGAAAGAQIPGISAPAILGVSAGGGNPVNFYTNGRVTTQQFAVSHTASAVNYVQVTGAATGNIPTISSQGSDANIGLNLTPKGTGTVVANGPFTATGQTDLGLNGANNQTIRALAGSGAFPWIQSSHASGNARLRAVPTSGAADFYLSSTGSGSVRFWSNAFTDEQFRVSNTASAVNYVQVTGAATGAFPVISSQGSDSAVGLNFNTKGGAGYLFQTNGATRLSVTAGGSVLSGYTNGNPCFTVTGQTSQVNGLQVAGSATGASPVLSATGSDANIDLTLTTKGTGNVRFGTYTANMALVIQGYIEIKDSGGTVRKLAVIA